MNQPIHDCLKELGAARTAGVFSGYSSRSQAFPWQSRSTLGSIGARWARLAIPVAAAAGLAIAFVIPSFHRSTLNMTPQGVGPASSVVSVEQSADQADCNADGQVNGLDISCFVRQTASGDSGSALQAEQLSRRLLGT